MKVWIKLIQFLISNQIAPQKYLVKLGLVLFVVPITSGVGSSVAVTTKIASKFLKRNEKY